MTARNRNQGPSLPKSILEHIDREESSGGKGSLYRRNNRSSHLSRKDTRKQERLVRKQRKAEHFTTQATSTKRKIGEEPVELPETKRRKTVHFAEDVKGPATSSKHATRPRAPSKATHSSDSLALSLKSKQKPTALEKLASKSASKATKPARRSPQTREEEEEDAYIAYLETKLGYSNGGKRQKGDAADGLGDLLDFAHSLDLSLFGTSSQADGNSKTGSMDDLDIHYNSDDELSSDANEASDDVSTSSQEDQGEEDNEFEGQDDTEDEWAGLGPCIHETSEFGHEAIPTQDTTSKELQPQPAGRYIPPGLRKQAKGVDETQEDAEKLTRQLKGLINRMSEQNMSTVLDGMEEIYRKHRRHDVTSSMTTLIIDGISSHAMLLDSFVVLHAAFISSMHKLIGIEFAAFIVQNIVFSYERHLRNYESDVPHASDKPEDRGKECSNLIVLLSELYNFQVISCILLYDIVRDLLSKELSEFRVELLLKILRNSGQQLRQDDPLALKDIVTMAQSSIAKQADDLSTRTKFMIETLTNLKNNKIKRSATQHQGGDAVERMKKFLSGLGKKRHVQAHEPLRVSLDDLRSAETKGKWWLVGAAWGGDPLADQQHEVLTKRAEASAEDINDTTLVKLARKQGMNTDIRRSIFVVLMSSDDYLDACERLAQLNLSEVQQREIVRVILHCCGNEKSYNPYYSLVCQQLCQTSHSYKITLQFCLWDFLRDLGETNVGGAEVIKNLKDENVQFGVKNISSSRMKNVAKAYGWWMSKDCCSLTILKPVDFTLLKPQPRKFLKELLVQIFVASQASSPLLTNSSKEQSSRDRGAVEEIFVKATKIENLGLGLIFFLSDAFKGEEGLVKWASTVARETLQTGMNEIPRL
ncbi:hypothetical protein PAXRUDRAFT_828062 [Paxillus rubicundulus Ve08.2h10]|uniref:MI domain-containing protein n=1 Tax=Paxillus rubicundulus Ve08.2h10 TaxID=930991 RepID=A0A0D0DQ65_9AGAM|nr:hypothetical protein PAXRUDRAFT_828062 [Paxillus rubicundulus Ve08.2h10]